MTKSNVVYLIPGAGKIYMAEQIVIGSVLLDSSIFPVVETIISHSDFANPQLGIIFQAFQQVQEKELEPNLVNVTEHLHNSGKLDMIGGPGVLASLADNVGTARESEFYAKSIREASVSREYAQTAKLILIEAE